MNRQPRFVPWSSPVELQTLKEWFYNSQEVEREAAVQQKRRAIEKVKAYLTKSRIPHAIESTAFLTELQLTDDSELIDEYILRMSYSMAIIRFVNGLLDPSQQSVYAIPLHTLAKKINLPSYFVELRHAGTHEGLPSLELLRLCADSALDWLFENYWSTKKLSDEEISDASQLEDLKKQWKLLFKAYRKIRREDVNRVFKANDNSAAGKEYWGVIRDLKDHFETDDDAFYEFLTFKKIIINTKFSFKQLKLLYEPLFIELIASLGNFPVKLLDSLLDAIDKSEKFQTITTEQEETLLKGDDEVEQAKSWCEYFILAKFEMVGQRIQRRYVQLLGKNANEFNLKLLKSLKLRAKDDSLRIMIDEKIQMKEETDNKRMTDIDDIFSDLENLKKRARLQKEYPIKLFETYPNWEPKPFGVL